MASEQSIDFERSRLQMVHEQIEARGLRAPGLLEAMRTVPRENFVPATVWPFAYDDTPLPIGCGQTISQPYMVAYMIDALSIRPADRVLEIGTGTGYAAAVMSRMAAHVTTVERHTELALKARVVFRELGYGNISVHIGDGSIGFAEAAPYDCIVVAAAGPYVPSALKEQLADGGRLVMPVGRKQDSQFIERVTQLKPGIFHQERLIGVRFVPLVGAEGWLHG